jgi:hypothetical protein
VGVFFLIYGAKSTLIGAAGSPLPYSDQWNFEALGLYRPYLSGTLDWNQLLAPYNEHRMFFTRLLLLGMFELRGGWDPIFDMLVNGLFAAFAGVIYAATVVPAAPERWRPLVFGFLAFCLVLPIGFENTLMGMNSHFFLFILFSVLAVVLMSRAAAFSRQWLGGFFCALPLEFTLASGALTPMAAASVALLQVAIGVRSRSWREIAGLALQLAAGILMRISTIPHETGVVSLQAHNVGDFLWAAISVASLPLFPVVGLVLVHAPLVWLLIRTLRDRLPVSAAPWRLLAIAAWVASQLLAIAYSRYQTPLSSRYLDIVVLLLPLDLVALTAMLARARGVSASRLRVYAGAWLFVVVLAVGAGAYLSSWRLAWQEKTELDMSQLKVTAFLASGDRARLDGAVGWIYPDLDRLAEMLTDPEVRTFLPAEVQPSGTDAEGLREKTLAKGRYAFIAEGLKTVLQAGPVWLALGVAFLFLAGARLMLSRGTTTLE